MSIESFKFRCTANLRLRVEPNTNCETIMVMAKDSIQTAVGIENDWYKVMTNWKGKPYAGYCYSGYCVKLDESSTSSSNESTITKPQSIQKDNYDLSKDEITKIVWDFLISEGLSANLTAAIMGNIEIESGGFKVSALGTRGTCFGLCQWTGDRYNNLKLKATSMGKTPDSLDVQLEYLMDELNGAEVTFASRIKSRYGSIDNFKSSNESIEKLTQDFMETFERPSSNPEINHISKRIVAANDYYNKFMK